MRNVSFRLPICLTKPTCSVPHCRRAREFTQFFEIDENKERTHRQHSGDYHIDCRYHYKYISTRSIVTTEFILVMQNM
jgi:hypothetical protein